MVYRIYVEKKPGLAHEAAALLGELRGLLGIGTLTTLRIFNRYDVENISAELFAEAVRTVLSEPQLDIATTDIDVGDDRVFAVEYLPGQFDQRADSAAQCIQIISKGERPAIRTAKVYALGGDICNDELEAIKKYVINPVEAREAELPLPATLAMDYDIPTTVDTLDGFCGLDDAGLCEIIKNTVLRRTSMIFVFAAITFVPSAATPQ